jgi:hypothetical protein
MCFGIKFLCKKIEEKKLTGIQKQCKVKLAGQKKLICVGICLSLIIHKSLFVG